MDFLARYLHLSKEPSRRTTGTSLLNLVLILTNVLPSLKELKHH